MALTVSMSRPARAWISQARPLAALRSPWPGEPRRRANWFLLVRLVYMLLTLFLFFLSAAVIYLACEFFVNGVEWVGHLSLIHI